MRILLIFKKPYLSNQTIFFSETSHEWCTSHGMELSPTIPLYLFCSSQDGSPNLHVFHDFSISVILCVGQRSIHFMGKIPYPKSGEEFRRYHSYTEILVCSRCVVSLELPLPLDQAEFNKWSTWYHILALKYTLTTGPE